jgi:ribosomal protein S18 acetylase RimI-like enzyme
MTDAMEKELLARGCPKINLQVRKDNLEAVKFYENIGYKTDEVIGMGKRLIPD